jgi:hypothetical protein
MIYHLEPHQVFIFGSNLAGRHAGGSAKQAREQFGAEEGIGEGMTNQCYAFPTLNADFSKRTESELRESVLRLCITAQDNPDKDFLLTKVGCGIAGYPEEYMKKLFVGMSENVILPDDWKSL